MDGNTLLSPPVIVGLWALKIVLVLMLPGLWMKLLGLAMLVVMPLAKRFIARQIHARITQPQEGTQDAKDHHVR
jgi:hypothetical protein